jgi:hypothetical protein
MMVSIGKGKGKKSKEKHTVETSKCEIGHGCFTSMQNRNGN